MKLSDHQILSLKQLLDELCGLNYTDAEAQQAGMAIIRFVSAKRQREQENQRKIELLIQEENEHGQVPGNCGTAS